MLALKDLFRNPTAFELDLAERYARLPYSGSRERNFEAFARTGLPGRRVEAWKYSDLRNAVLTAPQPGMAALPDDVFGDLSSSLVFRFSGKSFTAPKALPDGIRILQQAEGKALSGAEDSPVAALGAALSEHPGAVLVEISKSIEQPIHLVCETLSDVEFSRIVFVIRKGCEVHIRESHLASGGFSSRVVEYTLEEGAKLDRAIYQAASAEAVQVFTCLVQLSSQSQLNQYALGFGAKLCRNETRVFHHGEGALANLNSAYLLGAGRHYDQTSLVRHSHSGSTTRQLCKGAVLDESCAVFQGKFFVARKAQQTDAEMAHHALILENGGEVNAKPELEIYADDVLCAHGNTVGALDSDALFYMRQRGLPEKAAKSLLTRAFVLETLDNASEDIAERFQGEIEGWLEAHL